MEKKPVIFPPVSKIHSQMRLSLRYVLISGVYLLVFIILDYFSNQIEDHIGIITWYPPAGLTYAFLLVFGIRYTPAVVIAYFLGSVHIHNFPQPVQILLLWAFVVSGVYAAAAVIMRKLIHLDWHLQRFRDVACLIFTTVITSALLALITVPASLLNSGVPGSGIFRDTFIWWVGETNGVLTVTPFLLIHVLPAMNRMVEGRPFQRLSRWSIPRLNIRVVGQVFSLILILYWVFGVQVPAEFNPMFLLALPMAWFALDHGIQGVSTAILALNIGVLLVVLLFGFDFADSGALALLLIVINIVSLLTGAIVSERKRTENSLSASESKLRALFTSMQDAVLVIDRDGVYQEVAPTNKDARFLTPQKLIGNKLQDVFPADKADFFQKIILQVLDSKQSRQIEYELDFGDRSVWYQASVSPMAADTTLWVARDITGIILADQKLRESESKYRSLVDKAQIGITRTHLDGTIEFCNPAMAQILNYDDVTELYGINIRTFYKNHDDRQRLLEILQKEEGISNFELEFLTRDGRARTGMLSVFQEGGIISGMIQDVTARKQAEEQIHNQAETMGALYELTRNLLGMDDVKSILDLVTRKAVESAHVTFACFLLLEKGDLVLRSAYPARVLDMEIKLGQRESLADHPICQRVLEGDQPLVLQKENPEAGEFISFFLGISQNLCIVPLHFQEQPFGILLLGEARQTAREPFTVEKIRLADSIGDQAASALHRARLGEQANLRLQRIACLSEIDNTIAKSFDLRLSLEVILRHVIGQLKVDAAAILVVNTSLQSLEFKAGSGFRSQAVEHIHQQITEGQAGKAILERRMIHYLDVTPQLDQFARPDLMKVEQAVSYIAMPLIVKGNANGVLEIFHRSPLNPDNEWFDFLNMLAGQAAIAIDHDRMFYGLQRSNFELALAYDATIEGWSHALDLRDKETEGHTLRVTQTTVKLAQLLGISNDELKQIRWGALLHDIGKMGIPDAILHKPGPLTEDEWVEMKKHPQFAYDMIAPIKYLQSSLDIPYCHHEKWDGSGYPRGLKDEQIPLAARIFAVVDVWDALTSDRPYRAAWSQEKALDYIRENSSKHFDPQVAKVFQKNFSEIQDQIYIPKPKH